MEKVLKWVYRTLSYYLPCGFILYNFVIENLLSSEVSVMSKLGVSGVFVLAILIVLCIFFTNKAYTKKERELEKLSIKAVDLKEREELIKKWEKTEKNHSIFKNLIMLAIIIVLTILVALLESKILSFRGTMIAFTISFLGGQGCYIAYKNIEFNNKHKE